MLAVLGAASTAMLLSFAGASTSVWARNILRIQSRWEEDGMESNRQGISRCWYRHRRIIVLKCSLALLHVHLSTSTTHLRVRGPEALACTALMPHFIAVVLLQREPVCTRLPHM